MKKLITPILRSKIQERIKNRLDISDLIEGYDISGENLSRAIIKSLNLSDMLVMNVDFSDTILGDEQNKIYFNRATFAHCSFLRARLLGTTYMRYAHFKNCNFRETYMPYIDYKFSKWDKCGFCDAVITIGTSKGVGALFDNNFFSDLSKHWGVIVLPKTEYENLVRSKDNGKS